MRSIHDFDIYIFDCDGVILNSNNLKIDAMTNTLQNLGFKTNNVSDCIYYFKNNFGKSRFHHVEVFLHEIIGVEKEFIDGYRKAILDKFSSECRQLYLKADVTPGFIDFLASIEGKKYVASGSEQGELRDVFKLRGLDVYFDGVFGSPTTKNKLIENILNKDSTNAVMFGDAVSDLEAAESNNIQFIFYSPYSNVKEKMIDLCYSKHYPVISDYTRGLA